MVLHMCMLADSGSAGGLSCAWAYEGKKAYREGGDKRGFGVYLKVTAIMPSVSIKLGWHDVLPQGYCGGASHLNSVVASRRLQLSCSALMLWNTKGLGSSCSAVNVLCLAAAAHAGCHFECGSSCCSLLGNTGTEQGDQRCT